MKGDDNAPWLPLDRHGQGVKSLSVIYLFSAFVERLLKEVYSEHSEPIVALEEPEVHLHPQAVRALWSQIDALPGQKIIATHSPYFVQYVPIRDVRLLRRASGGTQVHYVPENISVALPANAAISAFAAKYPDRISYEPHRGLLSTTRPVEEEHYREILICYTSAEERAHHAAIKDFHHRSYLILEPEDLEELEDWARRIRGEIFFSHQWLLCEGQSEVYLFTALFDAIGMNLDAHGVSLIDYQNNGSARAFASLARTFAFPWVLLTDGDDHGKGTLTSLKNAGFSADEVDARAIALPAGNDLEAYIVSSAWRPVALEVAKQFDPSLDDAVDDAGLADALRKHKPLWARRLGERLRASPPRIKDLPNIFWRIRTKLIEESAGNATAGHP
jgi:putative ATP-dependent endonuclease of OLD family